MFAMTLQYIVICDGSLGITIVYLNVFLVAQNNTHAFQDNVTCS